MDSNKPMQGKICVVTGAAMKYSPEGLFDNVTRIFV